MPYNESYTPSNGNLVFSPSGYQRIKSTSNGYFYYTSEVKTDILTNSRWKSGSCWETGDFYYIEGSMVYKRSYDGTLLSSATFSTPVSLVVVQNEYPMPNDNLSFSGVDNGCWIVDLSAKKLIRTDSLLVVTDSIINLFEPSYVVATPDGGCYLFEDSQNWIIKVSSNADVEAYIAYNSISISGSSEVRAAESDGSNGLWVVTDNLVNKIAFEDGGLSLEISIDILTEIGLSSGYIKDISVEQSTVRSAVYVAGCYNTGSWIAKLALDGSVTSSNVLLSASCPSLVQTSQWGYSDALYIVSEEDEAFIPDECFSSSSEDCYFDVFAVGGFVTGLNQCGITNPLGFGEICQLTGGGEARNLVGGSTVSIAAPQFPSLLPYTVYNWFVEVVPHGSATELAEPDICDAAGTPNRQVYRTQGHWGYVTASLYTDLNGIACQGVGDYDGSGCVCSSDGSGADISIVLPECATGTSSSSSSSSLGESSSSSSLGESSSSSLGESSSSSSLGESSSSSLLGESSSSSLGESSSSS